MSKPRKEIPSATKNQVVRWSGLSRDRVERALATLTPVRFGGATPYYDVSQAWRATLATDESTKERKERADAEMKEERLRRLRGESINRKAVSLVMAEILKRLADTIRGIDRVPMEERRRLCGLMRQEVDRMDVQVDACTFEDAVIDEED